MRGMECLRKTPADDLVRIGIGDQMQITAAIACVDVGDITDPKLTRRRRYKVLYQILILMIAMVGIGSMTWLGAFQRDSECAHQVEELIPARNPSFAEHTLHHEPEFEAADTGILLSYFACCVEYAVDTPYPFCFVSLLLVIGLPGVAKQLTCQLDRKTKLLV